MTYDFKDLSVAVIDESAYIARVTVGMLRVLNIRDIKTFTDVDEMMASLASGKIDMIMTELDMEPVDGLTFIRKIRSSKNEQVRYIPLVVTAGFATKRLVNQARNAGADDFLVKPFSVNTLYGRLVELTERRQPFVETKVYFGPDRRRKMRDFKGDERRAEAPPDDSGSEASPDADASGDEVASEDKSANDGGGAEDSGAVAATEDAA